MSVVRRSRFEQYPNPAAMRILMSSHAYAPSIGGLETVSALLANEFIRCGHDIRIVTQTPDLTGKNQICQTWRRPSPARLLELVRWCDVYFHNNISLPRAWPLLVLRRPWVVAHHVWIPGGLAGRLKRLALRRAVGISASRALAAHLTTPSTVVANPYDASLYRELSGIARSRDLVYVGRLVSDKGVNSLLAALVRLARDGLKPTLTIVGFGPEEAKLRAYAAAHGLDAQVHFEGPLRGESLVRALNAHRLIVIPSLWEEPFGLVALEGIACGCVAVGSDGGGLPEAIGRCGVLFRRGSDESLAESLAHVLRDPGLRLACRQYAADHLAAHRPEPAAQRYLEIFERAVRAQVRRD